MRWIVWCATVTSLLARDSVPAGDLTSMMQRGAELHATGNYDGAAHVFRDAVTLCEHTEVSAGAFAATLTSLGVEYFELGRYAEASRQFTRAMSMIATHGSKVSPLYAMLLTNQASVRQYLHDERGAEALMREAISVYEKVSDPLDARLAFARNGLAWMLIEQRRFAEAEPLILKARDALEKAGPSMRERLAIVINNEAALREFQGRPAESAALFEQVLAMLEEADGPDHPHLARALNNLGTIYFRLGKTEDAEAAFRRALRILEARLDASHPQYASVLDNYAQFLRKVGRKAEAKPLEARVKAARTDQAHADGDGMTIHVRDLASFR